MKELSKGYVPKNKQKTAWGVNVFLEWQEERNKKLSVGEHQCPLDLLEHADPTKLNYWLSMFVTEVRKKDGSPYLPRSIHL